MYYVQGTERVACLKLPHLQDSIKYRQNRQNIKQYIKWQKQRETRLDRYSLVSQTALHMLTAISDVEAERLSRSQSSLVVRRRVSGGRVPPLSFGASARSRPAIFGIGQHTRSVRPPGTPRDLFQGGVRLRAAAACSNHRWSAAGLGQEQSRAAPNALRPSMPRSANACRWRIA